MNLFSSIAGPILVLIGLAGAFGFGIPAPYWLIAEFIGIGLIMLGQRREKRLQEEGDPAANVVFTQKRHRFWIFVMIASIVYAASSFWLPAMTPEIRSTLCWTIMLISFVLCVGIFLYSSRKKP